MPISVQEAGRRGAAERHNRSAEENSAIARKAAATRRAGDPDVFTRIGQLAALKLHSRPAAERRKSALKAAQTRRKRDPDCFINMGKKGGKMAKIYRMG